MEFHRKKLKTCRKRILNSKSYIDYINRKNIDLQERQERERVKALKNQDINVYIDLIKETKNQRILDLL